MVDILKILFFASSPEPKGELIRKTWYEASEWFEYKKS